MWVGYKPIVVEIADDDTGIFRPAPSWPDSSTCGALHRHRRGQSSDPRSDLNQFGPFSVLLKQR